MSYKIIKQTPSAELLSKELPVTNDVLAQISRHRLEIERILRSEDRRLLIIVGPCSAWPAEATLEYAKRLFALSEQLKDSLKLVMRVYIQKPRTIKGWAGPLSQPDPFGKPSIEAGIWYCRRLMRDIVTLGLPIADEALFTHNARGFLELLSWVAIGARSSEDQEHRIFASSIDCPVGIKNPTHGSLKIAVNGVVAAQSSHHAIFDGFEVETTGNPYAHVVLRGGDGKANCTIEHMEEVAKFFALHKVQNPAIIVDVSHDNCIFNGIKDYKQQAPLIMSIMQDLRVNPKIGGLVKGFMLESFLKSGRQDIGDKNDKQQAPLPPIDMNGLSITDACLGWEQTKNLLIELANMVSMNRP